MFELVEEDGPPLSGFVSEGGEDGVVEVLFDGFAVALVEVAGPVVGGALGAHVVACSVGCRLILRGVSIEQSRGSGVRSTISIHDQKDTPSWHNKSQRSSAQTYV